MTTEARNPSERLLKINRELDSEAYPVSSESMKIFDEHAARLLALEQQAAKPEPASEDKQEYGEGVEFAWECENGDFRWILKNGEVLIAARPYDKFQKAHGVTPALLNDGGNRVWHSPVRLIYTRPSPSPKSAVMVPVVLAGDEPCHVCGSQNEPHLIGCPDLPKSLLSPASADTTDAEAREYWDKHHGLMSKGYLGVIEILTAFARKHAEKVQGERDHWKHNHDEMVARNALLRTRPDLPADRVKAHDALVARALAAERDRDQARAKLKASERRAASLAEEVDLDEKLVKQADELRAKLAAVTGERDAAMKVIATASDFAARMAEAQAASANVSRATKELEALSGGKVGA